MEHGAQRSLGTRSLNRTGNRQLRRLLASRLQRGPPEHSQGAQRCKMFQRPSRVGYWLEWASTPHPAQRQRVARLLHSPGCGSLPIRSSQRSSHERAALSRRFGTGHGAAALRYQRRILASVRTRRMTTAGLHRNGVRVALFAKSATPVPGSHPGTRTDVEPDPGASHSVSCRYPASGAREESRRLGQRFALPRKLGRRHGASVLVGPADQVSGAEQSLCLRD